MGVEKYSSMFGLHLLEFFILREKNMLDLVRCELHHEGDQVTLYI